jgi:hypothetical protein
MSNEVSYTDSNPKNATSKKDGENNDTWRN